MSIKKILIFISIAASLVVGCSKDLGNYDYHEINKIEIDSIKNVTIQLFDTLHLQMNVKQTMPEQAGKLEYLWYYYPDSKSFKIDTLGTSDVLNYKVEMAPDTYEIFCKATDTKSGRWAKTTFNVKVISDYSSGVLMLGTADNYLSLSMVNEVGKIYQIYGGLTGKKLGSSPVTLGSTNTEIFVLCNDERGGVVLDVWNMLKQSNLGDVMYAKPAHINIQKYSFIKSFGMPEGDYILNDGQFYFRKAFEPKFAPPAVGDYVFSPDILQYRSELLLFDQKNGRFKTFAFDKWNINDIIVNGTSPFDPENVKLTPLYITKGTNYGAENLNPSMIGIFKDESGQLYKLIAKIDYSWMDGLSIEPFKKIAISDDMVPGIRESKSFAVYNVYKSIIYYAYGNKIYMYDVEGEKPASVLYDFDQILPGCNVDCMKTSLISYSSGDKTGNEIYVCLSNPNEKGLNGHLVVLSLFGEGNPFVKEVKSIHKNVCGKTTSIELIGM